MKDETGALSVKNHKCFNNVSVFWANITKYQVIETEPLQMSGKTYK